MDTSWRDNNSWDIISHLYCRTSHGVIEHELQWARGSLAIRAADRRPSGMTRTASLGALWTVRDFDPVRYLAVPTPRV